MKKSKIATAVAAFAVSAVVLSGCSAGGSDGTVTLDFWSWAPNTQELVDVWNEENPNIQVTYTDAGGGKDSSAKLLTASRAGNAPDIAAVEYPTLPSLIVADVPLEITDYVSDVTDNYAEGTLALTTFDGHVMALPQDVGPMALVYRSDLLAEWGIPVPTTWAEFRTAAAAVREANPDAYIASLPADQWAFYAGVASRRLLRRPRRRRSHQHRADPDPGVERQGKQGGVHFLAVRALGSRRDRGCRSRHRGQLEYVAVPAVDRR
jgi:multiple sugar transport system substrate-binding protein